KLARRLNVCLVFGLAERIKGDVFNCAVFIDHRGRICGKYHKMQLAEGYHPSWWYNRLGRRSRAFDTPLGRCGILICNDRWNPRLAEIPVLDGAQFLVIPSFGSRSAAQDEAVLSRGRENRVPVVEANVGVTLVVDDNQITAVDRREEGITFGTITVRPSSKRDRDKRDVVEKAFLEWRQTEMVRRYQRTLTRLKAAEKK
ncbi:MAG: carbon-nitrogen hydrolase family protein, partial [Planctomycetaceae bacterium]|nr:carbon-nitrogen hydrolase family protein [Planctomycetaceae bacterium]